MHRNKYARDRICIITADKHAISRQYKCMLHESCKNKKEQLKYKKGAVKDDIS